MNGPMILTLAVLALASALFISGKVRSDLVAIGALIVLLLFNILTPAEALSGIREFRCHHDGWLICRRRRYFSDGVSENGQPKDAEAGRFNETRMLVMIMVVTAAIGAFVSNTGTIAVMMPVVVESGDQREDEPGADFSCLLPLQAVWGGC